MAELRGLHQRLEAALGRLDSAVETRLNSAELQERVEALAKQLDHASAENAKLHETADAVAHRLDTAIDRIRKLLGD